MNNKVVVAGVVMVAVVFGGISAEAKFGVKLPGAAAPSSGGGDISALKEDLKKQNAAVSSECSAARASFKLSYAELALALGMKDEASKLKAEADALKSGNTSISDLKKNPIISEKIEAEVQKKLDVSGEMTPEQKEHFWNAVGHLTDGLAVETAQVAVAVKLGEMAKKIAEEASGMDKAAAAPLAADALALAAVVPGDVKAATATLARLRDYAAAKGMKAPSSEKADEMI
jgi:hypothetical protein